MHEAEFKVKCLDEDDDEKDRAAAQDKLDNARKDLQRVQRICEDTRAEVMRLSSTHFPELLAIPKKAWGSEEEELMVNSGRKRDQYTEIPWPDEVCPHTFPFTKDTSFFSQWHAT